MLARDRKSIGTFDHADGPGDVHAEGVVHQPLLGLEQVVDHLHDVGLDVAALQEDFVVVELLDDDHHVEHPDHVDDQFEGVRLEAHDAHLPDTLHLQEEDH